MQHGEPSQTAIICAACRASHLVDDSEPFIFVDPLAAGLVGDDAGRVLRQLPSDHPILTHTRVRATARTRYAEDQLALACAEGLDQYVILGAGLESFAYRSDLAAQVHTYEVDHPATQQWKRERVAASDLVPRGRLTYASVDFTKNDNIVDALTAGGLDLTRPVFVSWMGVTFYMTPPDIASTALGISRFAQGSHLVAEYNLPGSERDDEAREYAGMVEPRAVESGEPWLSTFLPGQLTTLLEENGWKDCRHLDQVEWIDRELWNRADGLHPTRFAMIVHART